MGLGTSSVEMIGFLQPEFLRVSELRQAIRETHHLDEGTVVARLLASADAVPIAEPQVKTRAEALVKAIREEQKGKGGVDALLKEFSLSTEEGIVLMCLAEALLRVPDNDTADDLIRDKLMSGNWSSHLGQSDSLFVNASAWGLLMTGKVTRLSAVEQFQRLNGVQKTIGRLGEPVIRVAMKAAMEIMGTQFVLGTSIEQATKRGKKQEEEGYRYSFDMLGEGARTQADAEKYLASYKAAITVIGQSRHRDQVPGISVKLSALHPRYEPHRDLDVLIERLLSLALLAKSFAIGFTVDAEEASRLDMSLTVIESVFLSPLLAGWGDFGIAVQAYQKRAPAVLDWAINLARQAGRVMNIRLVKGAYWDSEIKWAQQDGLFDYPVFTRKPATDLCYRVCAEKLLKARPDVFPQFATHNAQTVATVLGLDDLMGANRQGFEFQRLHGMGESLYDALMAMEPVQCRIYAPVGEHKELLAYLVRRLLENGANSSFVNNIIDETIPVARLSEDPVAIVRSWTDARSGYIPLPMDLYRMSAREAGSRANAQGIDLADDLVLNELKLEMDSFWESRPAPVAEQADANPVLNPASGELIGLNRFATAGEIAALIDGLRGGLTASTSGWSKTTPGERAAALRRLADLVERDLPALVAYCICEAGKTLADSVSEVREAVDFCRYYADQAESLPDHYMPLGVVLCISPWNFPVAIFLGQIAAALSVGNQVIGKPAEQTSLVARHLATLIYAAGIPDTAFQLLVAEGEVVGTVLVPHSGIAGVMFTGSDEVARLINRNLPRHIPLIAETGGQNAMIVDSTALFEQVVDDVMLSGFNSAGQRCSALRVLYLQADVADRIIAMIEGAMACLSLGDPASLQTDVGPVIDEAARQALERHVAVLRQTTGARVIYQLPVPTIGNFFPPTLVELDDPSILQQEVFGPIVHIVRYQRAELDQVIEKINQSGFGLTFGMHSRIAEASKRAAAAINAGNVYINRNMVGAIVGVQPFGGRGRSGTGPKAGGPNYLYRLVQAPGSRLEHASGFSPQTSDPETFNGSLAETTYRHWAGKTYAEREAEIMPQLSRLSDASARACGAVCEIARSMLTAPHPLPGPTGEDDQLHYGAKGVVAVLPIADPTVWWCRVIAILITGNVPILIDAETRIREVFSGLSERVFYATTGQLADLLMNPLLQLVLGGSEDLVTDWCREKLARREGAIVPYLSVVDHRQLVRMLLNEKVVSIDTTAAGGNATLLNAAGRDEGLEPQHGASL